jgi:hypothetical protein
VEWSDRSRYLWGNSVYAFGGVLIRCFANSGWVADIRGSARGRRRRGRPLLDEGGVVDRPARPLVRDRPAARGDEARPTSSSPTRRSASWTRWASSRSATATTRTTRPSTGPPRSSSREVRRAGGDDQRPPLGDAPVHPLRLAVRALPEGHRPATRSAR